MQRLEQFSSQKKDVQWHLPSAYTKEMSLKSTVVSTLYFLFICVLLTQVPIGIIDLNENGVYEMAGILDQLHKYVPTQPYQVTTNLIDTDEELTYTEYNFHQIVCTGDQLTVARHRTAKAVQHHSKNQLDRLEGLIPSVEDWYTKQVLVKIKL